MTAEKYGVYRTKNAFSTFLLCWVAYFSTYVCRLNYSAVMPELRAGAVFPESRIAAVSSVFFICYGLGQFVNGLLGERLDTRKMIFFGLFSSSFCNLGIFLFHQYPALLLLWGINGLAQSMVWTPVLKIGSLNFDGPAREKFGVDLATTVPMGTLFSYLISLVTLLFLPWHWAFLTCGLFELGIALLWLHGTKGLFRTKAPVSVSTMPEAAAPALSVREIWKLTVKSGVLLLLIPIVIQGTLKDSVTQWVPSFFAEAFGSGTSFSLLLTMLLPVVNVTGAFLAKTLNRRLKNEIATSLVFFGVSLGFLLLLRLSGSKSMLLSLLAMAGVTNCMFAVNVMLITLVPLRFAKTGRVSTIGGLLNAVAYIGCGGLNLLAGKLLEKNSGWDALFLLWMLLALAAIGVSLLCIPLWRRFCRSQEEA